jgi:type I restriction enzyme S subunit
MARKMKDSGLEWIPQIPAEWLVRRNKQLFKEINERCENGNEHTLLSVSEYYGIAPKSEKMESGEFETRAESLDGYKLCKVDDVVMNIMLAWKKSTGRSNYNGIVSPAYCVYRKKENIDTRYYHYLFRTDIVAELFKRYSTGIIDSRLRLYPDKFLGLSIVMPPIEEQIKIADFLSESCKKMDSRKLKQSVITQAVTKGVRGERPMKASGIEWIGEIPQDWEVRRVKTLFDLRDEKNYLPLEEVNLISLYTDLGVVQHADLEKTSGNKASNADGYKIVKEDDIVVNIILCWMGAIGRSAFDGVTSPAYDIYVPKTNIVESRFYHYYFRTTGFSGDCYKRGRGIMAMRWRTYSDQFRDIKVAYPSIEEQHEILRYLDKKCAAIDTLISKKEQFLTELENYKKSLIYEYVTGKKEVL